MVPRMLDVATRTALLEAFDDEELLDLTRRLIAIESHHQAPGQETPVATYLRDRLQHEGIAAELQEVEPGRCNVLGWLGSPGSGPTLMLNGHIDTVPPGEMPRPFEPLVADGRLHGRGASDMKGAVAAQAYALICLRRSGVPLNGRVLFAGVVGEEQGTSQGSMHLLRHGPKPDLVVVGEPTALRTAVCHRGFDYYRIDVKGRAAHSSRPEQGVNAVHKAAAIVAAIQERLIPETSRRVHSLLGAAPINVAAIIGASQNEAALLRDPAQAAKPPGAIVPDWCTIHLDRRRLPGETLDAVLAGFENLLADLRKEDPGLEAEVAFVPASSSLETHPPLDTPADHPLATCTAAWSTEVTGTEDRPGGVPFWSDAALFQEFSGIPSIVYGPGHIEVAHSAHESVPVEHLGQAARVYTLLAASLGGPAMVASAGAAPPK